MLIITLSLKPSIFDLMTNDVQYNRLLLNNIYNVDIIHDRHIINDYYMDNIDNFKIYKTIEHLGISFNLHIKDDKIVFNKFSINQDGPIFVDNAMIRLRLLVHLGNIFSVLIR